MKLKMRLFPSGQLIDPLKPDPDQIELADIAHALSQINRFNGHTRFPYSVGQHSLLVCDLVPEPAKLEGLMHDAVECYVQDIVLPLKSVDKMAGYREIEDSWAEAVSKKFELGMGYWHDEIKLADRKALATELKQLVNVDDTVSVDGKVVYPLDIVIPRMLPEVVEDLFIATFIKLAGDR